MGYELHVKQLDTYEKRRKLSFVQIAIVAIAICFIVSLLSNWFFGLPIGMFVFIVQFAKSSRWDKYFISAILIEDDMVKITYFERGTQKAVEGKRSDFIFEKKIAFNKTKTAYLAIYYQDTLILKQFEIPEWSEKKIDEVIVNVKY